LKKKKRFDIQVRGVATTGSGRKFIGKLIGADVILDEISTHARAAFELDPAIDTIIEIGGQDSKFTTMKNGMVTFSQMNTVCAAGTGSFLEEQASRLGIPIEGYSDRAMGAPAPLTSDRCTVFMERDINSYFHKGYSVEEILAAALFSVRENYLLKVASQARIGEFITFQGATAKNRALVAAFQQKLGKPVFVSPFCHLTGALGAALYTADQGINPSSFCGTGIWKESIPVKTEYCPYCRNRCRILTAEVKGEQVAYGFLCGRDYETHHFVDRDSTGFDLLAERAEVINTHMPQLLNSQPEGLKKKESFLIGIPSTLHLAEDIPFWTVFFSHLGVEVLSSEKCEESIQSGKQLTGAEFCTPMAVFHAHCRFLSLKTESLFIPIYIEDPDIALQNSKTRNDGRDVRKYCYYTQFAPSIIKSLEESGNDTHCIMPLIEPRKGKAKIISELYKSLKNFLGDRIKRQDIDRAYKKASIVKKSIQKGFQGLYRENGERGNQVETVLLGRPYTVLDKDMNGGIPGIIRSLGITTWYQDMIPVTDLGESGITDLIHAFHWNYASRILEAAEICAGSSNLYPILITSFKCSPDSFLIEYFKKIFENHGKPYLILQLDEHDSSVGYETRIEAALRTFKNHYKNREPESSQSKTVEIFNLNMVRKNELHGKTILIPNWDTIVSPLITANLKWAGYDARLLEENDDLIRESMRHNTGQCIPVNIILEDFAAYIRSHDLDPSETALWMGTSKGACNLPLFPYYMKSLLESHGPEMAGANIYLGEITFIDLSPVIAVRGYLAYLLGGMMRRLSCSIRPYEYIPGKTDTILQLGLNILENAFLGEQKITDAIEKATSLMETIDRHPGKRRKVAVFGDLYVRDNDILNQDLVRFIETSGGEVVTTPYNVYMKIISRAVFRQLLHDHNIKRFLVFRSLLSVAELLETKYTTYFDELSEELTAGDDPAVEKYLNTFNISLFQEGESWENILKIFHLTRTHPDLALFVQTNPAFCCPSLVTEAMAEDIERVTGVPVVTLTYDGTGTFRNDLVAPYLKL
jgi:predicted CoA-substrate-specific enzyme activase